MRTGSIALLIAFSLCFAPAGSASENTVRVLRVDCGTRAELAKVIRRAPLYVVRAFRAVGLAI